MGATVTFTEPGTPSLGVCFETTTVQGLNPTAIEAEILSGFSTPALDRLRKELVANCSTSMNTTALARTVVVLGAGSELRSFFQTMLPQITAEELAVKLCSRRRVVDIDAAILPKTRNVVATAMAELRAMGVTGAYVELLENTYAKDNFNSRVAAVAAAVVMAAAVEAS